LILWKGQVSAPANPGLGARGGSRWRGVRAVGGAWQGRSGGWRSIEASDSTRWSTPHGSRRRPSTKSSNGLPLRNRGRHES
jgi:hypothetical protein